MGRLRAAGLFLGLGFVWGSSFPVVEMGLQDLPPLLFAALRFDVAGIVMLAYAVASTDRWRPGRVSEWTTAVIIGIFVIAGFYGLTYVGQLYVTGAVAAVVVSLGPVMASVFAAVLLPDEHFGAPRAVGLVFGLVGVSVIASPSTEQLLSASVIGVGFVLLASASFNFGSVLTRPFRSDLPVQSMQAWGMLFGASLLHGVALVRGESLAGTDWTLPGVVSLAYLGLVSGALAYLVYFYLLDRLGAMEITLIGYVEPAFAALVEWVLLGRVVSARTVVGFVAIALGFAVIKRAALRETVGRVATRVSR